MKQTTVNEFKDGLNLDLHPIVTPKTVLTDNLNGTFITYNGNEFCLQNDRGNKKVAELPEGFVPIGAKEYNEVIYIVAANQNGENVIGHYPGLQKENDEYLIKGDLQLNTFTPFQNLYSLKDNEGNPIKEDFIGTFGWTVNTPVTIDIQPSYDGSVNLIIVADGCKTRIINSGFSVLPDNKYEIITRNQKVETNLYNKNTFDEDSNLIRINNVITNVDLLNVKSGGQFKGGNYTFYIKFGDDDYNQTDVVAESGIVSIFNGVDGKPSTISGTLLDERTDKMIQLKITGLNSVYSKLYIYYSREYSDTLGYRMTEYGMFNEPIDIKPDESEQDSQTIWLTGFEQTIPINSEELNVDYHTVDWARAESQHSNMLFLGNIGQKETFDLYQKLKEFSLKAHASINQGTLYYNSQGDNFSDENYYWTKNIYYRLGYWPEEYYRFGIVYILDDGSTTPVFNIKGDNDNEFGVYKTPRLDVLNTKNPIYFQVTLSDINDLGEFKSKIKGWFVVRQKRIPITICQALAIGTDKRSYLPVIWTSDYNYNYNWYIESFLSLDRSKTVGEEFDDDDKKRSWEHILRPFLEIFENDNQKKFTYRFIKESNSEVNKNALLSLDPCVNTSISGMFDGSLFNLQKEYTVNCNRNGILFNYNITNSTNKLYTDKKIVFIQENTVSKVLGDNSIFSNVAGSGSSAGDFAYTKHVFGVHRSGKINYHKNHYVWSPDTQDEYGVKDYLGYNSTHNVNLIRGIFTPYLGINQDIDSSGIYSIKINEGDPLTIRNQDNSEYYCVSERIPINTNNVSVYRGDCYICKVGMRILRNFIDNTAPVTNTIVDPLSWERFVRQRSLYGGDKDGYDRDADIVDYSEVNLSDLNAVDLGYWVTFPCLSSYNLGLRSLDTSNVDEMALLGSPRSFYPLSGASALSKVGDSYLLNDGLSATVGRKRYNIMPDVPYSKSEFANRIMFSNVHATDAFTNGYRTFQGLSYKDYDKQYGAITKLISLGQNIFIVMEHGLGLVPVNPKALMQTTTGEAIHIYGHGVLPDEMTVISQDYGSKYEHSVIRTPIGIYGIDVDAKKVWRFSDKQGFETISDMKVETYLKDYLEPLEINIGAKDIRTHYNANKGDLMFTWYNGNKLCSICFNERQNLWTTRYDWCPIVSENINDNFHSINKDLNSDSDYIIWEHSDDVGTDGTHVSNWYNGEQGFEFEFVVSDPIGVNKIFDNLQIISNNVQPQEMEITVIGDDYEFKRDLANVVEPRLSNLGEDPNNITTTSNIHGEKSNPKLSTVYKFDKRLNQSAITKWQPFKDIYKFGRRIGNIQYKEGSWYTQIEPLLINDERLVAKEARIRDKWARIRIRYSGKDLAVITAIKTLINI